MFKILTSILLLSSVCAFAQTDDELIAIITDFQKNLDYEYLDKEHSPLKKNQRKKFVGHRFYPIDLSYVVQAEVVRFENPDTIVMPTSAGTEKKYLKYAALHFTLQDTACVLMAYQPTRQDQKNYLFIPFRDATSGVDSYGGGRYMDLDLPAEDHVILNFNLAYNPYCAYTTGWYCPLPPAENTLAIQIRAGLMMPNKNH